MQHGVSASALASRGAEGGSPRAVPTRGGHSLVGCCARALGAQMCRDRLYAEILKKKREMHRLIKDREAAWAARQVNWV